MIRALGILLWVALLSVACGQAAPTDAVANADSVYQTNNALEIAYQKRLSNVWVESKGKVSKLLADDNKGARHQKFLVKISNGKTLLFAHNIDLARRIEDLKVGDAVMFRGEYVYNPKGGVMHWTHRDPRDEKSGGWIKHNGQLYQ